MRHSGVQPDDPYLVSRVFTKFVGNNLFDNLKRESFSGFDKQSTVWMLVSWPPLGSLFAQKNAPNIIRICALLARRPSAGKLIPVMLEIPSEIIYPLLTFLYVGGYICPIGEDAPFEKIDYPKIDSEISVETASFLAKTWHKLINKLR